MNSLNENMFEYKSITDMLIESLENENYDLLDTLLEKRQVIIEDIKKIHYSANELYDICKELKILDLQNKLDNLVRFKTSEVKTELKKIRQNRAANRTYSTENYVDSIYFNKKI